MEHSSISRQLVPVLFSAAMPGLGQLLQGRCAMAIAQFLLTGIAGNAAREAPIMCLAVLGAHGLSAYSAATFRRPLPA